MNISQKPSFASFSVSRQTSSSTLSLSPRPSDASSYLDHPSPARDPRKSKSSLNIFQIIKTKRSRSRLRSDAPSYEDPAPPLPTLDHHRHAHSPSGSSSGTTGISLTPLSIRGKLKGKKKALDPGPDSLAAEFKLDTDLDRMDGIIDPSLLQSAPDSGSPRSAAFDPSASDGSSLNHSLGPSSSHLFSNPFLPSLHRTLSPSAVQFDGRKISPTTRPPEFASEDFPGWVAPESWAVEKEGDDHASAAPESSDEEDASAAGGSRRRRKQRHRNTLSIIGRPPPQQTKYKIRIYRANGTYHVVACELNVTVAQLMVSLNKKLDVNPDREPHSLYLKERGRGASPSAVSPLLLT